MAKRYMDSMDPRRRMEVEDANMIPYDRTSMANMPQQVIMKEWPKHQYGLSEVLNDGITGIDRQEGKDHSQMMKNLKPHKY